VKQAAGDLWRFPCDTLCITTNGTRKHDGQAVMGRGVAAQAAQRWPWLPQVLGDSLVEHGNHVAALWKLLDTPLLLSFPVKHHWREIADLGLIVRSCRELMRLAGKLGLGQIALVRPGCGNGGLSWKVVEPRIAPLLDDRVTVVYSDVVAR
jgi:hypothetical protein